MNDQKPQPGQRNIASQGDRNINASGDNPTFNFFNTPPERSAKHQLRAPVGDFVGRENEIAELIGDLTNGGQVSISGISGLGGIGKTELALVVANRLIPNFPDAQLLVELRGTDPTPRRAEDALADCVRAFVGVEARLPDDLATLTKLYRDCLSDNQVLVLLDNAADADQVRPFLVPAGSALLVTSRETISLPKMKRIRLEQLPPDKARELLQEIAPRVSEAIADQICFLCGYLPLAVRAAASLLDVTPDLDPAEYAAELSDERRRLELKYANAEGHEISVEASFNLSYARLSAESARVFRSLSVFPASFDATAEEAICQDAGHKLLSDLLRRNLVIFVEAERRYRLHDLARVFANTKLSDDEREGLKLSHARHFCDVLAEAKALYKAGGEKVVKGMALFDRERTNIETGQAWAAKQFDKVPKAIELCAKYPLAGTYVLDLRQHPRTRIGWLEIQLAAARHLKRSDLEGFALSNLGSAYEHLGETDKALDFHKQDLAITRKIRDRRGESNALGNLGKTYALLGEPRKAIIFLEQQLALAREIGFSRGESSALGNLGNVYAALGETRKAIVFYEQALVIDREIGDRRGEGTVLGNLGIAYANLGETHTAIKFYKQYLAIAHEIGDRRGEGNALGNLGNAYLNLGETHKSIEFHEQDLTIRREIGDRRGEGNALVNLGNAYAVLGETHKAIEFYEQALVIDREIGDRRGEGADLWNIALALDTLGERESAIANAEAALTIYEAIESPAASKVRDKLAKWRS